MHWDGVFVVFHLMHCSGRAVGTHINSKHHFKPSIMWCKWQMKLYESKLELQQQTMACVYMTCISSCGNRSIWPDGFITKHAIELKSCVHFTTCASNGQWCQWVSSARGDVCSRMNVYTLLTPMLSRSFWIQCILKINRRDDSLRIALIWGGNFIYFKLSPGCIH